VPSRPSRGVREVRNHPEVLDTPGAIRGLQSGREPPAVRFGFFQRNWTPSARVFAVASGVGLLVIGLARRGILGRLAGVAGAAFAIRGISNTPWRRLLGIRAGREAVTFQKEIDVRAPAHEVYAIWSHFENFPLFMQHVLDVRTSGRGLSHWVVRGPAETNVSWDAITTKMVPNQIIAWKTLTGAVIASTGAVTFQPNTAGGTRIAIRLAYNPPAGALGNLLAGLFGADPKQEMDDDLVRFKSLIEDGKTIVRGQRVTREQVIGRAAIAPAGGPPPGHAPG